MPDIRLSNQPFDLAFHPFEPILFASLLTGEVKAWQYDDNDGESSIVWSARCSKRTARCVSVEEDGSSLWMGSKAGGLFQLDSSIGSTKSERVAAHEVPINRVHSINLNLLATGDDDGVIRFWDPRRPESVRTYSQHFDYISDFTYFDDKRQLVGTSGDGHLSVIDIRSSKHSPLSVSDDQDDELLSIAPIKDNSKCIVGSGLGILSIWNQKKGWDHCVDRIPGHPASIDAIVTLTPDVIATGSEDGMIRVMQVLPHKFLGVIASHLEYPIERMKLDRRQKWLGSVSHDDCIKLTDVEDLFEDSEEEHEGDEVEEASDAEALTSGEPVSSSEEGRRETQSYDELAELEQKTKKQKRGKAGMGDSGRSAQIESNDSGFFADL